jgi:alpha-tubulin suppressor-like RCC1 family protein
MNIVSSVEPKQHQKRTSSSIRQLNHSWNTSKIEFSLTSSIPNTRNLKSKIQTMITHQRLKRCLSNETTSPITVDKKQKNSAEPSSFVLVCGQNICGQLGLSTTIIERHKPQYLKIVNKLNMDENIQYICAGAMHSCALTVTGYVYTWGCNDDGALGRITNDIDDEYIPGLFVLPEEIKTICAGDSFTVALAKSGRAYISGCFRSSEGILGLFEYQQIAQQAMVIPLNQSIKQIACGADFCLLLTENGSILYSKKNYLSKLIIFKKLLKKTNVFT